MKKQNFFAARFMLVLPALVVSLLFIGASYAACPPTGTVCFSYTVFADATYPGIIGQTFDSTWTITWAGGSHYIATSSSSYPDATGTVEGAGKGNLVGNTLSFQLAQTAVNTLLGSPQLSGVWQVTLVAPAKPYGPWTGTYWGTYTYFNLSTYPPEIGSGYNAGEMTQVKCPK